MFLTVMCLEKKVELVRGYGTELQSVLWVDASGYEVDFTTEN